jgi:hypothetical protein
MRKSMWIMGFVIAASLTPSIVRADNITYDVNINLGGDILTGTITTDGQLGQLTAGDISSYSLTDSQNLLGATLTPANSTLDPTGATQIRLFASPTQITPSPNGSILTITSNAPNPSTLQISGKPDNFEVVIFGPDESMVVGIPSTLGTVAGTVPEIDPSSGTSALALVATVICIIRGRRKILPLIA